MKTPIALAALTGLFALSSCTSEQTSVPDDAPKATQPAANVETLSFELDKTP